MKKFILFILFFTFLAIGQSTFATEGSQVYFSGPKESIAPESEFLVSVYLDAGDPINAFDLEIIYPKDKLEFLNFDNTQSIVNIWQPSPTVLPNGNLRLTGGIIKAFKAENGLIVNLSFRALNSGQSELSFAKSSLYIADGKGTEIKVLAQPFDFSIKEDGKIISSPTTPFKTTPENILIEKELENFKSQMFFKKIFIPALIFIVLVFGAILIYNKHRPKP